jgi:polyphenol oxidase
MASSGFPSPGGISPGSGLPRKADGLITDEPGLLLAIQTADCIPVLVADCKRRASPPFTPAGAEPSSASSNPASAACAWPSVPARRPDRRHRPRHRPAATPSAKRFSRNSNRSFLRARTFREVFDADPVRKKYPMLFLTQRAPGHSPIGPSLHVDLVEANRRQLLAAGLKPQSIQHCGRLHAMPPICSSRIAPRTGTPAA